MTTIPQPSSSAPTRSRLGRAIRVIFLVSLLPLGAAGTLCYQTLTRQTTPDPATHPPPETHPASEEPPKHGYETSHEPAMPVAQTAITAGPPIEEFERADIALATDDWDVALRELEVPNVPPTFARHFRLAVCREGKGETALARAEYERALDIATTPPARALARFGLVRCDLADRLWDVADERLRVLFLTSGHPSCRQLRVAERALATKARVAIAKRGESPTPDPLSPRILAAPAWDEPPRQDIRHLAGVAESLPSTETGLRVESQGGVMPRVTARYPRTTLAAVLAELADESGVRIDVRPAARDICEATPVELDVHSLPLELVLAHLVESIGYRAVDSGQGFEIVPDETGASRPSPAEALTRARTLDPREIWPTLALGNLAYAEGRYAEAATHFRTVMGETSESTPVTIAAHNLGLLLLSQSRPREAKAAFLAVVDAAASPRWVDRGRWWVARANLDLSDTDAAREGFQRSLSASEPSIRSAAALGLVACHYVNQDLERVREILGNIRVVPAVSHERLRDIWASWAHYRTNPSAIRADRLRRACHSLPEENLLGPSGVWLLGQALSDAGDVPSMTRLYERESTKTRGEIGERMTLAVAEALDRSELTSGARTRFLSLASSTNPLVRNRARLALAEIDLTLGRPAECLQRLGRVSDLQAGERARGLRVKARAYESLGNYRLAAECYSGRDPVME